MSDLLVSQGRDPKRWLVLLACTVATLMVTIDSGILNLVIPAIQAEFNPSQSSISLLSSISTLTLRCNWAMPWGSPSPWPWSPPLAATITWGSSPPLGSPPRFKPYVLKRLFEKPKRVSNYTYRVG